MATVTDDGRGGRRCGPLIIYNKYGLPCNLPPGHRPSREHSHKDEEQEEDVFPSSLPSRLVSFGLPQGTRRGLTAPAVQPITAGKCPPPLAAQDAGGHADHEKQNKNGTRNRLGEWMRGRP
ncbi:hypothetical protein MGYG_06136 [Nannizzia gypsea CBS 118893]|uniref:Uncharacterized protein n=1 Tax=Arthroderma gypseum (strain ATCC MYA-4604 / CBS 118893) TaxID=535722 RepID=E4V0K4_ARTGP|nr:hypothetical protein MGYG_06136 [Nannizzia gypsea CBS 118893]EFR03141.1 hypothetical protein MGYG_06136 [Nannizzia gypsea CBS 118893]